MCTRGLGRLSVFLKNGVRSCRTMATSRTRSNPTSCSSDDAPGLTTLLHASPLAGSGCSPQLRFPASSGSNRGSALRDVSASRRRWRSQMDVSMPWQYSGSRLHPHTTSNDPTPQPTSPSPASPPAARPRVEILGALPGPPAMAMFAWPLILRPGPSLASWLLLARLPVLSQRRP
jgi:hypothetical protein